MISVPLERVSKKVAGRRLDARTWDQVPSSAV
jgi:protein gp37